MHGGVPVVLTDSCLRAVAASSRRAGRSLIMEGAAPPMLPRGTRAVTGVGCIANYHNGTCVKRRGGLRFYIWARASLDRAPKAPTANRAQHACTPGDAARARCGSEKVQWNVHCGLFFSCWGNVGVAPLTRHRTSRARPPRTPYAARTFSSMAVGTRSAMDGASLWFWHRERTREELTCA